MDLNLVARLSNGARAPQATWLAARKGAAFTLTRIGPMTKARIGPGDGPLSPRSISRSAADDLPLDEVSTPMSYPPPQYFADHGAASATYRPADTTPDLTIGIKSQVGYLATGATTEGQFGLYRWDMAAIPNT